MTTLNGPIDLSRNHSGIVSILDGSSGKKINITLTRLTLEYQRFYIHPFVYSLAKNWKIQQPGGSIFVRDLIQKTDKIHQKYGKIFDKFNRERDFILMDSGTYYMGEPTDCGAWIDKMLVVCK